jgi:predicted membrane channel-forming protein YqfA (hemolysin III family)
MRLKVTAWFLFVLMGYVVFLGFLNMYAGRGLPKVFIFVWFVAMILVSLSAGVIWGGLTLGFN